MAESSLILLEELTQADAVPGHEEEVQRIFSERLKGVGEIRTDGIGNIFCTKAGSGSSHGAAPRVMLDCHMDEVGFLVQRVTPAGYVKFVPVGGWWEHTLLAQRVQITTKKGKVPGVIGSTPPHLLGEDARKKVLALQELYIDIGAANAEQAFEEFGVTPGCPIAPYSPFMALKRGGFYSAKAFDNRVGVALVIEATSRLGKHPNTVIAAACAQEEVGMRGAKAAVNSAEPDVAIVLEAPPADDLPGTNPADMQGRLGGGCQIRLFDPTMIANPRLCDFVVQVALQNGIRHQIAVRHTGGTNAGAIHLSGRGVPSIVLGVPTRYIHSHVSIINIEDYNATLELLLNLIPRLDAETVKSFA